MRTSIDTEAATSLDSVEASHEWRRILKTFPYHPRMKRAGERDADYEDSIQAEYTEWSLRSMHNMAKGLDQAVVSLLREYYESGEWASSPLLTDSNSENEFLMLLIDHIGLSNHWSDTTRWAFVQFLTVVVPEIMKWREDIPELSTTGGRLPDDIYMAIVNDSGRLSMSRVAYRSISVIKRFKEDGGVTCEIARTVVLALMTDNVAVLETIIKVSSAVAAEAKKIKADNPDLTASEVAAIVGSTKDAVNAYLREGRAFTKLGAKVVWHDADTFSFTVSGTDKEALRIMVSRLRNLIDLED